MAELLESVNKALDLYQINYEILECDPELADTTAFCEHYGYSLQQSANTIIVASRKVEPAKYAICVVLGTTKLDVNKKVCKLLDIKRASFADAEITRQISGMLIGGVTAIGIKDLPIFVDSRVMNQEKIIMGGGNRETKLLLEPKELLKLPRLEVIKDLAINK